MDERERFYHDFPKLPRITVFPYLVIVAFLVAVVWVTKAYAGPIYEALTDKAKITLTDEGCK